MKYYRISEMLLRELIKESKFLGALESYGVDNWEGYEMAWSNEDYEVSEEDYEEYGAILDTEIDDMMLENQMLKNSNSKSLYDSVCSKLDNVTHKLISAEAKVKLIEEFVDCYDMREEWDHWNENM